MVDFQDPRFHDRSAGHSWQAPFHWACVQNGLFSNFNSYLYLFGGINNLTKILPTLSRWARLGLCQAYPGCSTTWPANPLEPLAGNKLAHGPGRRYVFWSSTRGRTNLYSPLVVMYNLLSWQIKTLTRLWGSIVQTWYLAYDNICTICCWKLPVLSSFRYTPVRIWMYSEFTILTIWLQLKICAMHIVHSVEYTLK